MRKASVIAAAVLACAGAGALQGANGDPLAELAGYYPRSWQSGDVSRAKFEVTDEVTIAPLDATSADITFALNFFNGHTCDLQGRATLQGRKLIFTDAEGWQGKACRLEIWRDGRNLRWTDRDNGCHDYCGMRGSFTGGKLPMHLRRPLGARPKPHID